jgi:hypothetical protein
MESQIVTKSTLKEIGRNRRVKCWRNKIKRRDSKIRRTWEINRERRRDISGRW